MKKIHFFAILLPLLGSSHVLAANTPSNIIYDDKNKQEVFSVDDKINEILRQQLQPKKKPNTQRTKPTFVMSNTKMINAPLIKQNPELRYGCEVTSLAMMLNYAGVKVSKMELYQKVAKDPDPIQRSIKGDILRWGNPHEGFVGDMTGRRAGYAVFDKPIERLVHHYLPGKAVNLSKQPFGKVLEHVSKGYPVVVWTTGDYRLPDRWEAWYHGNDLIKTPLDLHAVVLVGYDSKFVYLNDPLSGRKQVRVNKVIFINTWKAMNSRAVSYRK